jgi:hypothetical protein
MLVITKKQPVTVDPIRIDKVSMTMPITDASLQQSVLSSMNTLVHAGHATVKNMGGYYHSIWIPFEHPQEKVMLVQASPKTAKAFLRVEFNPFKNPMAEVHAMLNFIVPGGYSAFLAKSKLTRTDIAIDVHMVRPGQLLVTHQGFQTGNTFAKSGTVNGHVVGTKGSARHFVVYDKQLQLKKQNTKSPWKVFVPDHAVTRIEAQLKVDLPTSQIATLPNPFAKLAMADFGSIMANDDYTKLFLLAALGTGAQTALAAVTPARRKVFKQQLSDAVPTWWSPAYCWQAWPEEAKKVLVPPPAAYDLSLHKKSPPAMGSHLAH